MAHLCKNSSQVVGGDTQIGGRGAVYYNEHACDIGRGAKSEWLFESHVFGSLRTKKLTSCVISLFCYFVGWQALQMYVHER